MPKENVFKPIDYAETTTNTNERKVIPSTPYETVKLFREKPEEELIRNLMSWMEKKEVPTFEILTIQWESNDKLYIIEKGSFKLIKDGKETEIEINEPTIIWESTFLKFLEGNSNFPANATVEVKWTYYEISFKKLKEELDKSTDKAQILEMFRRLENNRKWKTKPVLK